MGKKKGEKEEKAQTGRASGNTSAGVGTAQPFRLPEPDRTVHVTTPAILPPQAEDAEEEVDFGGAPRRLQLAHLTLLRHPVLICAIDGFLTEEECQGWISWSERRGFEEAKQRQTVEMAFRENGRIEFESDEIAQMLWVRMRPFVPEAIAGASGGKGEKKMRKGVGCSPRIRVYRYVKGQRFGQHVDGSRDEPSLDGRTHFTVLVYLNGGERDAPEMRVRGGETTFWKDRGGNPTTVALSFPPTRGVCLFHGHGDECMIHEGAPVESGSKYVLRTDVVYEHEQ
eukprot:TRINITY_DN3465_c0_g1_i1.p1 TRINITY_DN3465_c0_g1~~TRINITY_DN3465_c0_g1_i1.p1  ORF type:complete len:283 (-),score=54.38 TRINITY_DN3465_c0_g1_i1:202-1050(-)